MLWLKVTRSLADAGAHVNDTHRFACRTASLQRSSSRAMPVESPWWQLARNYLGFVYLAAALVWLV